MRTSGGEIPPQHELEVHLQPGERGSQLVRRVGEKPLLHRARLVQLLKQVVEGLDHRRDLDGRRGLRNRPQIPRRAAQQFVAHVRERTQPARHAPPGEADRRGGDQQRRHELREQNLADEAVALVEGFADLHDVSVGRAIRGEAKPFAAMVAVEESVLAGRHRRGRRQLRVPVDDLVAVRAHLEDHRVEMIVDEHLERLLRQVDARSRRVDPDVVGDVERRIEQRPVVGIVGRAQRHPVRHAAGACDHQQQGAGKKDQQPPPYARRRGAAIIHRPPPTGSRSRAPCGCGCRRARSSRGAARREPRWRSAKARRRR